MIKTTFEKQGFSKQETGSVIKTCSCDVCGKTIFRKIAVDKTIEPSHYVYFDVRTMLTDLGNDSVVDTIVGEHICSDNCLRSRMDDYIETCERLAKFKPKIEITLEFRK